MPVVTYNAGALCAIIGETIPTAELAERMPMMGGDLDHVEGEEITIEWFPDRPDLLTLEGCGRALRAFLGFEKGLKQYPIAPATTELIVEPGTQSVRPYAALCFVRNVPIDDDYVKMVIQAQEKITLAPGRKRRKIAVGVHDAKGIKGPFRYTLLSPTAKFVPLNETREMTGAQIMEEHPKGREYAHLLPTGKYPAFIDGAGNILSLPPIINSAKTAVTGATRDLLLDVTGTDMRSVNQTMALLATSFAERGGSIEAVRVKDGRGDFVCPDLSTSERVLAVANVQEWLGLPLGAAEIADALEKMGHEVEDYSNKVLVRSPSWRFDLLHEVDLMEDIGIGYGFENFPGHLPTRVTLGGDLDHQDLEDRLRVAMVGQGFLEVKTLLLTNMNDAHISWGRPAAPQEHVEVENPVLEEQTHLRSTLLPSLMTVLARNRHRPLPQQIFEVGVGVSFENKEWANVQRFASVEIGAKAGFTAAKELFEGLARDLGFKATLRAATIPGFIPGRAAEICQGDRVIGHLGELHPETIVKFGLGAATAVVEARLDGLV